MNTPDTQKPVMTLEETMGGLSIWRQSFEITGKNSDLTEKSVKSLIDLLSDAYHHLEAGKELVEAVLDQNDFRKTNAYGGELPVWAHTMLVGFLVNQGQPEQEGQQG